MNPRRHDIFGKLGAAALVGVALLLPALPRLPQPSDAIASPDVPPPAAKKPAADVPPSFESRLDALNGAVLKRLEERELAEADLAEQGVSTAFAAGAFQESKRQLQDAREQLADYQEHRYPAEHALAVAEAKRAEAAWKKGSDHYEWAKGARRNNVITGKEYGESEWHASVVDHQWSEAKAKLDLLEKSTRPQRIAELGRQVESLSADLAARQRLWEWERGREAALDAKARSADLSPPERKAVETLDEANALRDRPAAEAKLKEAESLWAEAGRYRSESRRADARDRLRRALDGRRRSEPPPPPTPATSY